MAFRLVPVRLAIVVTLSDSVRICSRNAVESVVLSFFASVVTSHKWSYFGPLSRYPSLDIARAVRPHERPRLRSYVG